ncbi:MAG: acyloxyacyl hydrolase [Deltaproteobacteria bacterium]
MDTLTAKALLVLALLLLPAVGQTQTVDQARTNGPILAVGYSHKQGGRNLVTYAIGWRFSFQPPAAVERATEPYGLDLSLVVEPLLGFTTKDTETVEFSVVPMVRVEGFRDRSIRPFVEGGVGLAYSDLRGYNLGSRILFSDQIGGGVTFGAADPHRWSLGYRLRHISHAGLWAEANSGLNTHYLVVTYR